ncbi:hypothetical protein M9Y38_22125 [Escherichia coli]|nr:hypothetical protein [Escherichia coli]
MEQLVDLARCDSLPSDHPHL